MNKAYVYFHINPVKNHIFYVGIGTRKDRAKSKCQRNKLWHSIVNKYGFICDIAEEGLTRKEASEREKFYISKLGRRDLGKGNLVNMTDGGDGIDGFNHTKETRNIISSASKKFHNSKTKEQHLEIIKKIWDTRRKNGTDKGYSESAKKSWETRRKNGSKISGATTESVLRGWETRRKNKKK